MEIDYSLLNEAEGIVADAGDLSIPRIMDTLDTSFDCPKQHKEQLKQYVPFAIARVVTADINRRYLDLAISSRANDQIWWLRYWDLKKEIKKKYTNVFKALSKENAPEVYDFINRDIHRRLKNWLMYYGECAEVRFYDALNLFIGSWRKLTEKERFKDGYKGFNDNPTSWEIVRDPDFANHLNQYIDDNFNMDNKILKKQFISNERVM